MRILSLFDGMACGMLAFQGTGIKVDRYVAFEIDKYAVQTSSHNFPMIEHRGDVFQADFTEFFGFDFLVGGSPCTFWSIAQKNNRETEASGMGWELFSQYVRALKEAQPMYFIYENNKSMANAIRESITETFGFEPICINSALVSAQNRQRLYWVGKRNPDGTYSRVKVEQPEDRGILLRDVLDGVTDREKARCVIGSIGRTTTREYFKKDQGTMTFEPIRIPEYGVSEKARCLTASYAYKGSGEGSLSSEAFPDNPNKQVRDYVAEPVGLSVRNGSEVRVTDNNIHGLRKNGATESESFVYFEDGKTNALTTSHIPKVIENLENAYSYATPCEWDDDGKPIKAVSAADGKTYTVYEVKDGLITIKDKQHPIKLADGFYIIRKLTVSECKRLQTVPEWYEFPVSDTQAYKMLGNGWTVEVIAHLIKATQDGELEEDQLDLFKLLGVM